MSLPANLNWMASVALDRMLYCLAEGIALAALLSLAMRLFPPKSSRTRFAVWFSALIADAVLPVLGVAGMTAGRAQTISASAAGKALLTIPASWAESVFAIWALLAFLGLLRVGAGLWHIHQLRRSCTPINPELLGRELQSALAELKLSRSVSILVSPQSSVPAAVGFFRPVVVIPEWLAEETSACELRYVVLHELAHLRRWDDWTNLTQKVVKAALFFHPGIWWIERKLALDREMACDEAVLSEVPEPRVYAQCLARVAEKSFLRRKMALAQAAVDRMKHLSWRIARILSLNANENARRSRALSWKPAVAMVVTAGAISAVWTSQAPPLVRVADPVATQTAAATGSSSGFANSAARRTERDPGGTSPVLASLNAKTNPVVVPAFYAPTQNDDRSRTALSRGRKRSHPGRHNPELIQARHTPAEIVPSDMAEVLVTVVQTQFVTGGQTPQSGLWQISVVEVRWDVPAHHSKKETPRKI